MGDKDRSREQQSTGTSRSSRHQTEEKTNQKSSHGPTNSKKIAKQKRQKKRQKEDRLVRRIVLVIVIALIIVGATLGYSSYKYVRSSLQPLDSNDSEKISIEVPIGSSNKMIGEILEANHIVKSGVIFNYFTKFNNYSDFQAGQYSFSPDMTLDEISKALLGGSNDEAVKIVIPEGYSVEQIADTIAENTSFSVDDVLKLANDADFFASLAKKYPDLLTDVGKAENVKYRLEGYLFPATYDYSAAMSLEDLLTAMVTKSEEVLANYYEKIAASDFNVHEVLTLASLVEKEGQTEEDRKNIAQVFINRLNNGMMIQSDISVLYALGEHKETVTYDDIKVDSPYNLYVNQGMGPGPFDSPSEQAINAVLNPIANDYLYFVADVSTGEVYFAYTLEEHNELVEKYVNQ